MRLTKAPSGAATSKTRMPSSAPGGLSWLAAVIGAPEARLFTHTPLLDRYTQQLRMGLIHSAPR